MKQLLVKKPSSVAASAINALFGQNYKMAGLHVNTLRSRLHLDHDNMLICINENTDKAISYIVRCAFMRLFKVKNNVFVHTVFIQVCSDFVCLKSLPV